MPQTAPDRIGRASSEPDRSPGVGSAIGSLGFYIEDRCTRCRSVCLARCNNPRTASDDRPIAVLVSSSESPAKNRKLMAFRWSSGNAATATFNALAASSLAAKWLGDSPSSDDWVTNPTNGSRPSVRFSSRRRKVPPRFSLFCRRSASKSRWSAIPFSQPNSEPPERY